MKDLHWIALDGILQSCITARHVLQHGSLNGSLLVTGSAFSATPDRRTVLGSALAAVALWRPQHAGAISSDFIPAKIALDQAPDQSRYNPSDEGLRDAAARLQLALNAEDVRVTSLQTPRPMRIS
jgi:hypothetical protein